MKWLKLYILDAWLFLNAHLCFALCCVLINVFITCFFLFFDAQHHSWYKTIHISCVFHTPAKTHQPMFDYFYIKCEIILVITTERKWDPFDINLNFSPCHGNEHTSLLDPVSSDEAEGGSFFCFKYLKLFISVSSCNQLLTSQHSNWQIRFGNRWHVQWLQEAVNNCGMRTEKTISSTEFIY